MSRRHRTSFVLVVLSMAPAVLAVAATSDDSVPPQENAVSGSPDTNRVAPETASPDALPAGAVSRLGSNRYRMGGLAAGFLPDSSLMVGSTLSGEIGVWDVATGRMQWTIARRERSTQMLKLSPDGKTLAVSGFEHRDSGEADVTYIRLYEMHGKRGSLLKLTEPTQILTHLEFTADSTRFITGSSERGSRGNALLQVWDVESKKLLKSQQMQCSHIEAIDVSPDGATLAVLDNKRHIWIWNITGQDPPSQVEPINADGRVAAIRFSPDGRLLAIGVSDPDRILLLEMANQKLARIIEYDGDLRLSGYFTQRGNEIAWSPDGQFVFAVDGSEELNRIAVFGVESGRFERYLKGIPPPGALFVSSDGRWLVAEANGLLTTVFDLHQGIATSQLDGHFVWISELQFHSDGTSILTAGRDDTARMWEANTGREIHTFQHEVNVRNGVTAIASSPDGSLLATATSFGTTTIWDAKSGERRIEFPGQRKDGQNIALAFSLDGSHLISLSSDRQLIVRDVTTGNVLQQNVLQGAAIPAGGPFRCLSLPDDSLVLVHSGNTCGVFDVNTGVRHTQFSAPGSGAGAGVSEDGSLLATFLDRHPEKNVGAQENQQVRLPGYYAVLVHRVADGSLLHMLETNFYGVRRTAFSSDSRWLAVSGSSSAGIPADVQVFDLASGELRFRIQSISQPIHGLAFSGNGSLLATSLSDYTVIVWDLHQFDVEARHR